MKLTSVAIVAFSLCLGFGNTQQNDQYQRSLVYGAEVDKILVSKIVEDFTGLLDLEKEYKSLNLAVVNRDTTQFVKDTVKTLKKIFNDKEELVKRIAEEAEKRRNEEDPGPLSGDNITFYDTSKSGEPKSPNKLYYRNAKCSCQYQRPEGVPESNCTKSPSGYKTNAHFGDLPVSYDNTSVHIPTEIFNEDPDLLRDIYLTHGINNVMVQEVCKNTELSGLTRWVYYTTQSGAMRFFPDRAWSDDCDMPDVYDSRVAPWFLNSISSPKDVVVLVDNSGSVKGLTLNLLHRSVKDFLDTLTVNDYVNIILFNENVDFINSRCRGLLQATPRNKQILRNWVYGISTENQAFYDKGFEMVLKTLEATKQEKAHAAQCNPTVMFFTDGDSTYPSDAIRDYNSEKDKRIFSFVVGKNFYGKGVTKEIACKNRGYYDGIPSFTGTKPSVQKYLVKISEPLTNSTRKAVKWTLPYKDKFGLGFVISASTPVYENHTENMKVAGVVGTDLVLADLKKIILEPDMSNDYYPFIIDNNGFAVIHPNLIEANHDDTITIDFLDAEYSNLVSVRDDIIDGNSGSKSISRNLVIDKKYILTSMFKFDYAPVDGTVFKFGLGTHFSKLKSLDAAAALASSYQDLTLQKLVTDASNTTALLYSSPCVKKKMETFNPCEVRNDTSENMEDASRFKVGLPLSEFTPGDSCEVTSQFFSSLLLHGVLSDQIAKSKWESGSHALDERGVLAVFSALETPSFIRTKYLKFLKQTNGEFGKDDEVVKKEIQAILANPRDSSYMRRAIHNPSWTIYSFVEAPVLAEITTMATQSPTTGPALETTEPFTRNGATTQTSALIKRIKPGYILASKAVSTVENEEDIAPIVTGVVLHPETFQRNMFSLAYKCNGSINCNSSSWDLMCSDTETTECLILDDGGFLLASNQEKHYDMINNFFGLIDGEFMRTLINLNVYVVNNIYDYQAVCAKEENDKSAGVPRCFVPSITDLLSFGWWLSSCARMFFYSLVQNLIAGLWSLADIGSSHIVMPEPGMELPTNREHCILKKPILNYGPNSNGALFGTVDCKGDCKRAYTKVRMDNTNLLLIIAEINPECKECTEVTPFDNEEINVTVDQTCNNATVRYRKPPNGQCYDARTFPEEKDSPCSSAQILRPLYAILLLFTALHYIISHTILR